MKKIAFCFLIYDKINNEKLWKLFFKNIPESKYSIYIHYKIDEPLKYFERYKFKYCINTDWGEVNVVQAQNLLLKEGLLDIDNTYFINISGACIPFKSFDYIYNYLYERDITKSYCNIIDYKNKKNNNELSNYWDNTMSILMPTLTIFRDFSQSNIINFKNLDYINVSQWWVLNRKHADLMVTNESKYVERFSNVIGPKDELCYIYNMKTCNLLPELIVQETTFVNMWRSDYRYNNNSDLITLVSRAFRPKEYNRIEQDELLYLLNKEGLFFGRKFEQDCIGLNTRMYYKAIKSI